MTIVSNYVTMDGNRTAMQTALDAPFRAFDPIGNVHLILQGWISSEEATHGRPHNLYNVFGNRRRAR